MVSNVINLISARQASATVNEWLVCYVGDRFLAGTPAFDAQASLWRVPVLYVYPNEGPLGAVAEAVVDTATGELRAQPSIEALKQQALKLYQARCDAQNSPISLAGD